jgi:hypothetical protein
MIKLKSLFRRGQAPSGSKGAQPAHQIKGASSVSSLDDNLSTKQSSKKFGSKDKLDHIVYNKGSKEKLVDVKQPKDKSKRQQQQQQLPPAQQQLQQQFAQMPIQEQDTQQYHLGNNNVMDQRSTITSSAYTSDNPSIIKDQVDHFDGHKQQQQQLEVSAYYFHSF